MICLKKIFFSSLLAVTIAVHAQNQPGISDLLKKLETARDTARVNLLIQIGNYYLSISRFDSNKFYLQQALAEATTINFDYGKSRILTGLGYMHKADGEYDKALELFFTALKLKEKLKLPLEAASLYDAIGRVYIDLERPEKAHENFLLAKKAYEEFKDSARLLPLLSEIGDYYATIKDYQQAIEYYKSALLVYTRWEKQDSKLAPRFLANYKTNTLTNYAYSLIESGKPGDAITILEPLLVERKKIGGGTQIAVQSYVALAYLRAGNYAEAIKYSEEGIKLIRDDANMKLWDELRDFYRNAAEANFALGNYKNAYSNYKSFKEISDSISNDKVNTVIAEMQTRYETEKKDQQIVQLGQKRKTSRAITILALAVTLVALGLLMFAYKARKFQQKLFEQKETLLVKQQETEKNELEKKMAGLEQMALRAQMNPHFIFNCLNSVQHFILKQDIEGVNKYLGVFAHLIRQTLDNSSRQMIPLHEELKYLDTYLSLEKMKSDNGLNYEINVIDKIDSHTIFVPSMIFQPFVENSIKHGISVNKNNPGFIKITISGNGKTSCIIEDNGVGRMRAKEMKILQPAGYQSKGLSLTMDRIAVINKIYGTDITVNVHDITDNTGIVAGTRVIIEFPADME